MFRKIPKSKLKNILENKQSEVRLYTIQNKNILEELFSGRYSVKEENCMFNDSDCIDDGIKYAYDWIKAKGNFINYPIWATLKSQLGKRKSYWEKGNKEDLIQITLKKQSKDIILSDYDMWHSCLNGFHLYDCDIEDRKEIEKSWEDILDVISIKSEYGNPSQIQVCTDDIKFEDVVRITDLRKRVIYENPRINRILV